MKIYINERNEIHEVNTCSDPSLIELEVTDGTFDGWSEAKICCYKATVSEGKVTMMTTYVDSRLIEHIDQLGKQTEAITPWTMTKTAYIEDTECIFNNVPSGNLTVYCPVAYTVERQDGIVAVRFEALEEVMNITISIL